PPPSNGDEDKGKGGFQLIPWSELSPAQRAGRSIAAVVGLILILFLVCVMWRSVGGARIGSSASAPSAESSGAAITEGDRKDGIESLCKVFQIYGLPKNDSDATEDARNAGELAGSQSPERSAYILTNVVADFRGGKLGQSDCSDAGAPLPTNEETPDNSAPDVQRDNGQP